MTPQPNGRQRFDSSSTTCQPTTCFERSGDLVDVPMLCRVWARLRELRRTAPAVMTHGDLTPGNVLVPNGRLASVLDFGGLGPADPRWTWSARGT